MSGESRFFHAKIERMEMNMKCSHPVIYRIDGHLKCIGCGAVLDAQTEPEQNAQTDAGTDKVPAKKKTAKNVK